MSFKESIIAKLWWFFKLEKRRYIVGILALSLVSVLNLIPPMVMGRVIDAITSGKIDQSDLASESRIFAFGSFGDVLFALCLAHVYLGDFLSLRPDYAFTPFEHFTKMSPSFYKSTELGTSWLMQPMISTL